MSCISITNPDIIIFCKKHPFFSIEKLVLNFMSSVCDFGKKGDDDTVSLNILENMLFKCVNNINEKNKITISENFENVVKYVPNDIIHNQLNDINKTQVIESTNMEKLKENVNDISIVLNNYIDKMRISSVKGSITETKYSILLESALPKHTITRVASRNQKGRMDLVISKVGKPDILLDLKDYKSSVPKVEIEKFESDILLSNNHGIMVSPFSKISGKGNYEITVLNNKIGMYIHNNGIDIMDIQNGINIIYDINKIIEKNDNTIPIDFHRIQEINILLNESQTRVKSIKNHLSLALEQCDNILFDSIKKKLGIKSEQQATEKGNFNCTLCNRNFSTQRGINIHDKSCKRNNEN
jgi:hypothetical protein